MAELKLHWYCRDPSGSATQVCEEERGKQVDETGGVVVVPWGAGLGGRKVKAGVWEITMPCSGRWRASRLSVRRVLGTGIRIDQKAPHPHHLRLEATIRFCDEHSQSRAMWGSAREQSRGRGARWMTCSGDSGAIRELFWQAGRRHQHYPYMSISSGRPYPHLAHCSSLGLLVGAETMAET